MTALEFDNKFVRELPADPIETNSRRQVQGACYSSVLPAKVLKPQLLAYSREMAETLGFSEDYCKSQEFAEVFTGNQLLEGMQPYAMCYGGHQFGNWAGQLGDGRAINLGEVVNQENQRWVLQLKGAGPTPYSRTADGLAVLRSSVREFLCSEAMFHLGVPTTRALSLSLTGEEVLRDMFYDGHAKDEAGAVVCRVSPSFIRFGNFEIFAARGDKENLEKLVKYCIETDFPHLGEYSKESIKAWFKEVCRLTAEMIVQWLRVGFVHGVMNTDNMSIMGLTIDYGPYGWIDNYDPDWTPNTTDAHGKRYRFGKQTEIAHWNLVQLANAIFPLLEEEAPFHEGLELYISTYETGWENMMAGKLGLKKFQKEKDSKLVADLLGILQFAETDMSIFYRNLSKISSKLDDNQDDAELIAPLKPAYYNLEELTEEKSAILVKWIRQYQKRLAEDGEDDQSRQKKMNLVNPKYVLRNYIAQLAIDKSEKGDHSLISELLEILRHPYDEQEGKEEYAEKRPEWARHRAGCSMLSCSS